VNATSIKSKLTELLDRAERYCSRIKRSSYIAMTIAVILLNSCDALMTIHILENYGTYEFNPLMAYLLGVGNWLFLLVKLGAFNAFLVTLGHYSARFKNLFGFSGLMVVLTVYVVVVGLNGINWICCHLQ
jgi:hypothetical protein